MSVIPAVIPETESHLLDTLAEFARFAPEAQIDIVDGAFVSQKSWPYDGERPLTEALAELVFPLSFELDLMIQKPEASLMTWMLLRPSRIVVHLEAVSDLRVIFAHHAVNEYKLGLALNNDTALEQLFAIDRMQFDYVELMGIDEIGRQGQPFDERVLQRIRDIKAKYPDLEVSIDGSVNENTLPRLKEAGADRFVVGSAILNAENPEAMHKKLSRLAEQEF
jgi:ribulose-phosphate 3-epimerase